MEYIVATGLEEIMNYLNENYHFVEMQKRELKNSLNRIALNTPGFREEDLKIVETNNRFLYLQLGEFPITSCLIEEDEIVAEVTAVNRWISNIEMMKHMGFN